MDYFAYSQKEFIYKYVVMFSDIDQFKHMSFVNYLKLMYLASDALFMQSMNTEVLERFRLKNISSRMKFKRQTVSGDHILIKINSTEIQETRFSLIHTFVIEGTAELVCLGRQTYELLDFQTGAPLPLFEGIKNSITTIQVEEEHLLFKY